MSNDVTCRVCGRTVSESSLRDGYHECPPDAAADRIEELEAKVESLSRMQAGTLAIFYATAAISIASHGGTAQGVNHMMAKCGDAAPVDIVWFPVSVGAPIDATVLVIADIVERIVRAT